MIRLLVVLGILLYAGLWFLGADHGQFINPPKPQALGVVAGANPKRERFIPAQPIKEALPPLTDAALAPQDLSTGIVPAGVSVDSSADGSVVSVGGSSEASSGDAAAAASAGDPILAPEPDVTASVIRPMRAPGGASVRSGPGSQFPIVGSLDVGGVVMVFDVRPAPGWIRIVVDGGGSGFVAAGLLRE